MEFRVNCRKCLYHFNIIRLIEEDPSVKKVEDKVTGESRLRFTCPMCDYSQESIIWRKP